jgi:CHAT domain-containing protein/Tfp pilus assembly protein PilF
MMAAFVRGCATLAALALATVRPSALPAGTHPQDAPLLEPHSAVERRIVRGDVHKYSIALSADEHARVIVEQHGIDVIAQVRALDGQAVAEFQDEIRNAGQEQIDLVADEPGTYTIAIRPAPGIVVPGSYAITLVDCRSATASDRALQHARTLRMRAARLDEEGRFDAARSLLEEALRITEGERGPADLQTAAVAAQLASVYRLLPDDAKSEALFLRALPIMEGSLGKEHPTTAVVRSRLGQLYYTMGQRAKAEPMLQQSLDVIEKSLGTDNRWYVNVLVTLANLNNDAGDLTRVEEIVRRAMGIEERIDDTESTLYAGLLNNLGELYRQRLDYAHSEEQYKRSLAIGERVLGENGYFIATALQNLGIIARERKDYAAAEAYYGRALSIRQRIVGVNHPDVAQVLNNLATVYRAKGDVERSLQTHLRALGIWESAAGPYQQATLLSVGNIARTYAAAGDIINAIAYQRRTDEILEKHLALNVAVGSERQKLLFVNSASERTDRTISLHLLEARAHPDASALAALVLLQRKGRVQDAMADTFAAVRQRVADLGDRTLLDQLRDTTAQLARLALTNTDPNRVEQRQRAMKDLEARKERLEAALSQHSAAFRSEVRPVTLDAVEAAIPGDAALLEFAIFRPFDPKAERNAEAYGAPHYAVYVVRKETPPIGFDLGPAREIDTAVDEFRKALRDPRRADVTERARALDERVMRPLRASLGGAVRLIISPDGDLNLVPFEALVNESGRYLIERYAMSYVSSGRDLLRMQMPRASGTQPVIFADPLFGEPGTTSVPPHRQGAVPQTSQRSVTSGENLSTVYFTPLAATAEEANAIKALYPDAVLFTGSRASKATLQQVEAPRMLHIASHGFFLQDAHVNGENPLLRAGLALAGANLPHETHESGILTALEASSLNLWGTQLVTLSACDTGIGEIRNGEGVYGLRRAFVLAGAEALVMSLWPVSDSIARETMVTYYTGLRAGLGRGDALRQAKLALLKRKVRQHPFYWASFIQSGEWTSLDDPR